MAFRVEGPSTNVAEVTPNNELKVNLGKTAATLGGILIFSENDPGTVLGTPSVLSPETTDDWRLRVGIDTVLFTNTLNYTAQDSANWAHVLTTMTVTNAVNGATLNGSAITTASTGAMIKSYRRFPLIGAAPLYGEITALHTQNPVANQVMELGFFDVAAATTVLSLDGVFFRYVGSALNCVVNYNGVEVSSVAVASLPTVSAMHKYSIAVSERVCKFWIDDILVANIPTIAANGQAFASGSAPIAARVYNGAVAPATAQTLRVSDVNVSMGDFHTSKPWSAQMAGMGNMAYQGIGGMTAGQTANYVNSTAPVSATLSNTAAGYTTLGGQFQFAAVAGAETDYALFAYQVPAATATVTGRTLHITGVSIDTYNMVAAVATTATIFQWALGFGSTAVSLATAEAAAAKAPRRIPLGVQNLQIGAAVGAQCSTVIANFEPVCVNAGEFVHIILRMPVGTATATEVYRGVVRVEGYWE